MADVASNVVRSLIVDGYAIADEYRMTGSFGELVVLGLNIRTYDVIKQIWNIKWLQALAGTWVDPRPDELGEVQFDCQSIIYAYKSQWPPMLLHARLTRTFTRCIHEAR